MTSKIAKTTIASFVSAVAKHEETATSLMAKLSTMIETCGDVKAFRTDLYAVAKAKSEQAYAAIRKNFSRAVKALGVNTGETRGKTAKASAKAKKVAQAPVKEKSGTMTDALALARVGELANSFLIDEQDKATFSRLLAAISHNRQNATKAKK